MFSKAGRGRDVRFHGLAAPGAPGMLETEDLVAIWKTKGSERFQNYRAAFTILNAPRIERRWIDAILAGDPFTPFAPSAWIAWVERGSYERLVASS